MARNISALTEHLSALSIDAQALRSKDQAQPDEMLRLAKILARKARIELQLREQGIYLANEEEQAESNKWCPF